MKGKLIPMECEFENLYVRLLSTVLFMLFFSFSYEGEGEATFLGGHAYNGDLSKGMLHGKGTYTWADGVVYTGEFYYNEVHGTGCTLFCQV